MGELRREGLPVPDFSALETHRVALRGHCYRMLGSAAEADDAVQEAMVRAWRALDGFEAKSSLRTWLFRIATRVCLDALGDRARRVRPFALGPVGTIHDELTVLPRESWVEPIPDLQVIPEDADPTERLILRQNIRLAFIAALQYLPPRQRAALLLTDVLGWAAAEAAETLEMTVAALNSALQRARATLADRDPGRGKAPLSDAQNQLLERYLVAFQSYDVDTLTQLLREDAVMNMPPYTLWLQGREAIGAWFLGRGAGCRGSRLLPTAGCGAPAFGQYRVDPAGGHGAWALVILELEGPQIAGQTFFLDTASFFPRFGLPLRLPPE